MIAHLFSRFRIYFLLLISIPVLLFSCQKDGDDDTDPGPQEPDKTGNYLITEYNSNYGKFKLTYNDKYQITKAEYWYTDGYTPEYKLSQVIEYKYENGKATGYYNRQWNSVTNSLDPAKEGSFVFDAQGRLIKVAKHNGVNVTWEFDAQGRPNKSIGSTMPTIFYQWSYNSDGDIEFPHITSDFPGYPYLRWTEYKYTRYKNPLTKNGNGLLLYMVFEFLIGSPMDLFATHFPERGEVRGVNYGTPIPPGSTNIYSGISIVDHTYYWNENGTLKAHNEKVKYQDFTDNVLTKTQNHDYTYEIISVKK